ncbi:MAG: proteic killer suppression protein [Arenicella sp.]|jgi:proteic killer suppression protein
MIKSFSDKDTQKLFERRSSKRFKNIERVALRKLVMLHAAKVLDDLKVPPGNKLEALKNDRIGQHSIRVNQQWRICFNWNEGEIENVEICDYH